VVIQITIVVCLIAATAGVLGLSLATPSGSRMAAVALSIVAAMLVVPLFVVAAYASDSRRDAESMRSRYQGLAWLLATTVLSWLAPLVFVMARQQVDTLFWLALLISSALGQVIFLGKAVFAGAESSASLRTKLVQVLLIVLPLVALAAGLVAVAAWLLAPLMPAQLALVLSLDLALLCWFGYQFGGLVPLWMLAVTIAACLLGSFVAAPVGVLALVTVLLLNRTRPLADLASRVLYDVVLLRVLWLGRQAPWNYRAFLNYCADTVLLKDASGEYEFVHRMLRDHFAVRKLMRELTRASTEAQRKLVGRLSLQGEAAFETLKSLAVYPDATIRSAAVTGLGRIGIPAVVPLLADILPVGGPQRGPPGHGRRAGADRRAGGGAAASGATHGPARYAVRRCCRAWPDWRAGCGAGAWRGAAAGPDLRPALCGGAGAGAAGRPVGGGGTGGSTGGSRG